MPFYAKDWRSPGESWIKTEDGWEKLKVLETNRKRLISDDGVFYRLVIFYHHLFCFVFCLCVYIFCCYDVYLLHWSACYLSNDTKANGEASLLHSWCNHHELFFGSKAKPKVNYVLFSFRVVDSFFFFFFMGENNRMWGRYTPSILLAFTVVKFCLI